jgi:hypothetical protein
MKPASADVALIIGKRVQGSVKLSSPFFDDVTMTVKHKGKLTSFRNKVNIIYSKKQKISTDFNFRLAKVMKATFIFVSPFKGYKKVAANIKHEGTWKNSTIISIVGLIANLMSPESMSCFPRAISAWHLKFVNLPSCEMAAFILFHPTIGVSMEATKQQI